ncbi:uncharacterized protein LOC125589248 isoform X2 [Brassica napus]|uniref:uncharacterized protein LOC106400672 isoform X2 n=1 Tax=Brassica napus TaxID=3708 RepID=UPI000BBEE093|nr:uncharacterized protein LOC106400672 isoform X2 [Brassica napus]XP_048617735.1 uncharacterized protein LOC125589248 isoform X2 [Brassica napus]
MRGCNEERLKRKLKTSPKGQARKAKHLVLHWSHSLTNLLCAHCSFDYNSVKQCVKVAEKGHVKPANYLDSHQKILIGIATKGGMLSSVLNSVANCQRQAEERLKRSVVMVQATFMSKQAQENYRRMKLTHEEAQDKQVVISTLVERSHLRFHRGEKA